MNSITYALAALVLSFSTYAQIESGHVFFSVKLDADSNQQELHALYDGSTYDIYFNDTSTITQMNVGSLAEFSCLVNYENNEYLLLTGGVLGQKAIHSTLEKVNAYLSSTEAYRIEKTNETKDILGFRCRKFILFSLDSTELVYWTTKDIAAKLNGHSSIGYDMEGFPMEFEILSDGFKLKVRAKTVERGLRADEEALFDFIVPEDFRVIDEAAFFGRDTVEPVKMAAKED